MNIDEIKAWRITVADTLLEYDCYHIDWLIAEVERLGEETVVAQAETVKITATRCREIAPAVTIDKRITEEFNLPKAG